jgi:hypothetical protein
MRRERKQVHATVRQIPAEPGKRADFVVERQIELGSRRHDA